VRIETFTIQYPDFLFPGKTQFSDDSKPDGLSINRTVNSINPFNWISVGQRIRKEAPDMVISRFWIPFIGPSLGTISRLIGGNRKTTVIGLTDNIIPHEKKPGDRPLTAWFLNSCDGIIAMSESVLTDLDTFDKMKPRRYGPHPIYDHYGDISSREEALNILGLDPEFNYLLFFGLIRDYKGLDLVIESLADKRLQNKKIRLIVAGEFYANEKKYRDLVKSLQLENEIIFVDKYIPNGEVSSYFNACDMVVQPYKSATQSGVTQVAYHFCKPMLVTNVGGLPEIVAHQKAGYVCEPEPGSITEAILDFYGQNRKSSFENFVKKEKERFAWRHFTRLFYELKKETDDKKYPR
jgi:glycosyltransferase involved in cell wall biosynthesis